MEEIKIRVHKRKKFRQCLPLTLMWLLCLVYLETLLHIVLFGGFSLEFCYALGFTLCAACLLGFLTGLLRERANKNICTVLVCLLCFLFASQLTYDFVFGSMYSLSMVSLGGGAIKSFWKELLATIWERLPVLLLCFVPAVAVCLLRRCRRVACGGRIFEGGGGWKRLLLIAVAVLVHVLLLLCLRAGGTGTFTAYGVYHGNETTTDRSASGFGLMTTFRLELKHMIFPQEVESSYVLEPAPVLSTPKPTASVDAADGETAPPEPEIEYGYNVLDIDFAELAGNTKDERMKKLSEYCAQLTGTKKNKYTGMLSDYNLIVLCGEAFSTAALDEELTPTLWRMAHEGFVFTNYFNTYPNTTTDGEYSLCQGLLPDKSRGKTAPSFYASKNSYLPMCLGNIFQEQRGVESFGYHNHNENFYGRLFTHPNMGYKMKFNGAGMSFTTKWPTSDFEMMEQSVPDYLGQDQFNVYYMTFSGHYRYDMNNPMVSRNYDAVADLPYSETGKCYLACNLELEKAMAYLMEQLEAAGVADRTAIVMAGDHFPYGLTNEEYCELIGHDADFFELYRDTLIFWVGGMDEPVTVDNYCCNIDILPTILNLWGFDYDSRLLAGTDILSDSTHVAILVDKSFLTDSVWFNSGENKATWLVEENDDSQAYLESMIAYVQNRFTFSTDILNSAYYNYVFGKRSVWVGRDAWATEEQFFGTANTDDGLPEEATEQEQPEQQPEQVPEQVPEPQPEQEGGQAVPEQGGEGEGGPPAVEQPPAEVQPETPAEPQPEPPPAQAPAAEG